MYVHIADIPPIGPVRESEPSNGTSRNRYVSFHNREDCVSIGEESRLVAKLISALKKLQEEQDPSLEELKLKIADGTYNPSSEEIARAILYGPPAN